MENTELIAFTCTRCGKEYKVPVREVCVNDNGFWCISCAEEYRKQICEKAIKRSRLEE